MYAFSKVKRYIRYLDRGLKMKKLIKKTLWATLAAGSCLMAGGNTAPVTTAPVPLPAEGSAYVGGGLAVSTVETYVYSSETVFDGVLRAGYDLNDYVGVEARAMVGFSEGDYLRHANSYGLYLKLQYPVNEKLKVYGLLGYARTRVNLDDATAQRMHVRNHTVQDDFSGGVGVEYKLDRHCSVYADGLSLVNKSTTRVEGKYSEKVNSFSLGALYRF